MRAAIIDAHYDRFVVVQVGDFYPGAEGQLAMGGGQAVLVEGFAAGGTFALVLGAVIRGHAGFIVAAGVDVVTGAAGQQAEEGKGGEQTLHRMSSSGWPARLLVILRASSLASQAPTVHW